MPDSLSTRLRRAIRQASRNLRAAKLAAAAVAMVDPARACRAALLARRLTGAQAPTVAPHSAARPSTGGAASPFGAARMSAATAARYHSGGAEPTTNNRPGFALSI